VEGAADIAQNGSRSGFQRTAVFNRLWLKGFRCGVSANRKARVDDAQQEYFLEWLLKIDMVSLWVDRRRRRFVQQPLPGPIGASREIFSSIWRLNDELVLTQRILTIAGAIVNSTEEEARPGAQPGRRWILHGERLPNQSPRIVPAFLTDRGLGKRQRGFPLLMIEPQDALIDHSRAFMVVFSGKAPRFPHEARRLDRFVRHG
jgi:hypothetical protein